MENMDMFKMFGVEVEKKVEKTVVTKDTSKTAAHSASTPSKPSVIPTKKISPGEIFVRVYGVELFSVELTEEKDEALILEEIRDKIFTEYEKREFSKERTVMSFSEETRIVVPSILFAKKG